MIIEFEKVTKKFGEVIALDDVSFKVEQGEFVFITGRSGVGKSTILSLILGEYLPTEGKVWVDGISIAGAKKKKVLGIRRQMGVIYQDFRLLTNRTVKENILVALDVIEYEKEDKVEKVEKVLKKVNLEHRQDSFPSQLSGGELQRVCLARALVVEPKIIMADEPTGNLDPETSWEIMDLLKKINKKGTTVIMATHNYDIVNSMKQRVIKLDKGKLVTDKEKGKYE